MHQLILRRLGGVNNAGTGRKPGRLEGRLLDVEGEGTFTLHRHHAYTVARGRVHRTRSPERSVVLMIEKIGVVATGD